MTCRGLSVARSRANAKTRFNASSSEQLMTENGDIVDRAIAFMYKLVFYCALGILGIITLKAFIEAF